MTSSKHIYLITEEMIANFVPTWLYIKQHSITGMYYFGITISEDVERYLGSGTYWKRHIKKHGKKHVLTIWKFLFDDLRELNEFAISLSIGMDIVESKNWANLVIETGLGGVYGMKHSNDAKTKISNAQIGRQHSPETKVKMVLAKVGNTFRIGATHSDETKMKMSKVKIGKKLSDETKAKMSAHLSGSSWWNDGCRDYRIQAGIQPDPSWRRGKIRVNCATDII
jgi:hypothetical protein